MPRKVAQSLFLRIHAISLNMRIATGALLCEYLLLGILPPLGALLQRHWSISTTLGGCDRFLGLMLLLPGLVIVGAFCDQSWRIHKARVRLGFFSIRGLGGATRSAINCILATMVLAAAMLTCLLLDPWLFVVLNTACWVSLLVRAWESSSDKLIATLTLIRLHRLTPAEVRVLHWYKSTWTQFSWLLLSVAFLLGVPLVSMHKEGMTLGQGFSVGSVILLTSLIIAAVPFWLFYVIPGREVLRKIQSSTLVETEKEA